MTVPGLRNSRPYMYRCWKVRDRALFGWLRVPTKGSLPGIEWAGSEPKIVDRTSLDPEFGSFVWLHWGVCSKTLALRSVRFGGFHFVARRVKRCLRPGLFDALALVQIRGRHLQSAGSA